MEESHTSERGGGRGRGRPQGRAGARARARGRKSSTHTVDEPVELPATTTPSKLSSEDQTKLQEMREKMQVSRFLLPDAPPKKTKRSKSPERIACPLYPGTPETPPPRVPQPWELKKRKIVPPESSGPSRCPDHVPGAPVTNDSVPDEVPSSVISGPATLERSSPSTSTAEAHGPASPLPSTSSAAACDSVPDEAPSPAIRGPATLDRSSSPSTSTAVAHGPASPLSSTSSAAACGFLFEDDFQEKIHKWELSIGENPESGTDEADVDPTTTSAAFRNSDVENLTPKLFDALNEMDNMDDIVLREQANEDMLNFNWSSDPNVFIGQREVFVGQPGPTFTVQGMSPLDLLQKIWDSEIIALIVQETNRYANDLKNYPQLKEYADIKRWTPISVRELWAFFGICMLQSLIPLPVEVEYWKPRFQYLKIGLFKDIMSYTRFKLIKRCLHFVDNLALSFNKGIPNRVAKIQPIIDHLTSKFSSLYLPDQEIAIDESLLLWKGRLSFAQVINTKAAQVGIKSYELCESKSGYLWKMIIYAGKNQVETPKEHDDREETEYEKATSKIVFNLVRPLLHQGYTLVMDNFYNSPLLSRALKAQKTDTMGTLRLNREFVPDSLRNKTKANMRQGEVAFSQTKDMTIAVWKDANVVALISTYHSIEVSGKQKYGYYRYKPKVVLDYNLAMGGVDKKDQLLQAFPVERVRNQSWYKKLFRRLLNVSIHNAHVIFSTGTKISAREFRYRLADEIVQKFSEISPRPAVVVSTPHHFPAKTGKRRSRCKWCSQHKRDVCTVYKCANCEINLCIPDCFREYHISRDESLNAV